ncbi:MAG: hypothetical protein R2834_04445 [Rhodothermales bacterium]
MTAARVPWIKTRAGTVATLALLFALSVAVRAPMLGRPLFMAHEWLTAHVLTTLTIWSEEGISTYGYNPVYTFDTPADRHVKSLTSGIVDEAGNYYYVSYPPLTFLLPYAAFSLLHVEPGVLAIRIWSLLLHAITAIMVYALVASIYGIRLRDGLFPPALIAYAIYLFMPMALKHHLNSYFADMLVQPLWLGCIWYAFQLYEREKLGLTGYVWGFALLNFLAVYTEWLGVFSAFVLFVFALVRWRSDPRYLRVLIAIAVSTALALGLAVVQYSTIAGLDGFIDASIERFTVRSGVEGTGGVSIRRPLYHIILLLSYWYRFYPILGLLAFLLLFVALTYRWKPLTRRRRHFFMLIALGLPVIMHHVVFFDFTYEHEFAELKTVGSAVRLPRSGGLYHHIRYAIFPETRRVFHAMVVAMPAVLCMPGRVYILSADSSEGFEATPANREIIGRLAAENETIYVLGPRERMT